MMRALGVLGLAILSLANQYQGAQSPQATFRGRADFVAVDVAVRQRGRPVSGLAASDFELFDNGKPQEIADLSYEKLPIDVTIALDISSSVTGDVLDQLRRSVGQLTSDLGAGDRLRLLTFNTRISRLMDFTAPVSGADAAFSQIRAIGGTAEDNPSPPTGGGPSGSPTTQAGSPPHTR